MGPAVSEDAASPLLRSQHGQSLNSFRASNPRGLGTSDLHSNFIRHRNEKFTQLVSRDAPKYKAFLRFLRMYKIASLSLKRGRLLEAYYLFMRSIDDIVDGDVPLPESYESTSRYLQEKIRFTQSATEPRDPMEFVYLYVLRLSDQLGISLQEETNDILQSLLFDTRRRGQYQTFPKKELSDHYETLDIRGTIRAALKIFGERPAQYNLLDPLGRASRIYYDLQDYTSDLKVGIVNVAEEDVALFGIQLRSSDMGDRHLQAWFVHQSHEGLKLIGEHRENLKKTSFTAVTDTVLKLVYEMPARTYFDNILQRFGNV